MDNRILKLCIDCKHCKFNQMIAGDGYYTNQTVPCLRMPIVKSINLINGEATIISQLHCWSERYPGYKSDIICGEEGKYFEQK